MKCKVGDWVKIIGLWNNESHYEIGRVTKYYREKMEDEYYTVHVSYLQTIEYRDDTVIAERTMPVSHIVWDKNIQPLDINLYTMDARY